MKFKVMLGDNYLTRITANDENHAWEILKKMGFRNRSKTIEIVEEYE
jgi:hypothetical protein